MKTRITILVVSIVGIYLFVYLYQNNYRVPTSIYNLGELTYDRSLAATTTDLSNDGTVIGSLASSTATTSIKRIVTHVKTPTNVKALYMSSWVAGSPAIRARLVKLIDTTELNSVVIDVKDNSGLLSWNGRVADLDDFVAELHKKNIYVIGRVASFQDPTYVKSHPELAVTDVTTGEVWYDYKGVPWVDTGSKEMWDYLVSIGKEAHDRGFDEINYDYIRFPTDGALKNMRFPISGERGLKDKPGIVGEFYKYLHDNLSVKGIPISGDIFGIVLVDKVDIKNLGQDLQDAFKYFDYVAPMIYPSHFYSGTNGFLKPAEHPGEIIDFALKGATVIAIQLADTFKPQIITSTSTFISSNGSTTIVVSTSTLNANVATSTYNPSTYISKLRPWYQDFNMGAIYTADMVRAQITAGEKLNVNSWMLWDPANHYTPSALKN